MPTRQVSVYEAALHEKLGVQSENRMRLQAHKEIVEEGYQDAVVQAQVTVTGCGER